MMARSQKGLSIVGWLFVLAAVAFVGSTAMKMAPHYLDFMALEKVISSAEQDRAQNLRSVGEFYSHIDKGMQTNNIRDLNLKEAVKITQDGNSFLVKIKYEKREPMISNLDLVANFDKEIRVRVP